MTGRGLRNEHALVCVYVCVRVRVYIHECMLVCFCSRIDGTRLSKSFASAQTGMRFLMCQIMFNRLFAAKDGVSIDYVASQYDKHWSLLPWVRTCHTALWTVTQVPSCIPDCPCTDPCSHPVLYKYPRIVRYP